MIIAESVLRGDGCWKVVFLFVCCLLRCIISPVFGFLNFFTSLTEGFANALIGDFEQFARMQEQSDLLAKAQRRMDGLAPEERRKVAVEPTGLLRGSSGAQPGVRLLKRTTTLT